MMMDDDVIKKPAAGAPLDSLSIAELEVKITNLKQEIAACEREIAAKKRQRDAADALFGGARE